ncbi:4-galactosyl-N-acetylglucosaminide 3-alpha-L-fucosyltransferase 9-like [Mercenaria mercenaria]|uniref:4-galactosyl-N-acetylglucosaminide 3-alpha-L-fucosyltransferase 9-like n=1 Tax=Mercenaria mercenaria TaxID=6596 RepID=UPI00234EFFCC|nr:4-galactosyl-N-acetylglucosaminide 3-alpha-L-fucosyltransferase 9-like [Mercenaria mercenaria]
MLLAVRRATFCLYSTVFLCIMVVLLYYCFFKLQLIHNEQTDKGVPQRKIISNVVSSNQKKEETNFHHQHDMDAYSTSFDGKQWKSMNLRKEASEIPSQFIDPVLHFDIPSIENNYLILFWESPDWFKNWSLSSDINQCRKYSNCKQSFDRSLFNLSRAVVFNLPHSGIARSPPVVADLRNPNQVWVFFTLESPLHLNPIYKSPEWHNVFNWSWTYHPNADVFHPYGVLIKKQKLPHRNYSGIFKKKTKFAAWLVSNCNAPSSRTDYVNILKRYVDVDVFGRCGQQAPENIESVISEKYKFYLGFENSLCENYMTEKVFHYYKLDVITVLRGNTKYQDYLPSGSFIDTANFSSFAALAQYMKDLGENEEKYVSFLKVKDKFTVFEREFLYKNALCNLCEKINNMDQNRRTYGDIFKWLGECHGARDLKESSYV